MWWLGDLDTTDPPYALVSILKRFGADNAGPMGLLESINGPLQDLWLTSSCLYTALQNTLYECSLQCLSQAPKHHLDPGQQQGKGYIKSDCHQNLWLHKIGRAICQSILAEIYKKLQLSRIA